MGLSCSLERLNFILKKTILQTYRSKLTKKNNLQKKTVKGALQSTLVEVVKVL